MENAKKQWINEPINERNHPLVEYIQKNDATNDVRDKIIAIKVAGEVLDAQCSHFGITINA